MKGMKKNKGYNDATGFNVYERIQQLCDLYRITPYRISEDSGIGSGTISKWKNGDIKNISVQAIEDVCVAIGISLHTFFNDDQDEEQDRELAEMIDMLRLMNKQKRKLVRIFLVFVCRLDNSDI